jgi:site-specific DNA-cytosine methylase
MQATHPMKVLVACEYSGAVRDAFRERGHDAMSCDLLPTDSPGPHYQGDVFDLELSSFDLLVAFPPCTHLAVSGARWFPEKRADGRQQAALEFVRRLMDVPRIAIENPVSVISTAIRKPDQTIQPWQFGHGEVKRTCLWLKGLPLLTPTNIVEGREPRVWKLPPSADRWKERSKTFPGIAAAMADQWGRT